LEDDLAELFSKRLEDDLRRLEKLEAQVQRLKDRIAGARKAEVRRLERKLQP
jgi:hypothetical protein